MSRRILVPVDGSATSRRGLREAVKLAKAQRGTLFILHIVDAMPMLAAMEGGASLDPAFFASLKAGGRKVLDRALAEAKRGGASAKTVLAENFAGRVADLIVRQARKLRVDLIVIGTHGRRGLSRMVMGSDAELVVRYSSVPVLLVRAPAR